MRGGLRVERRSACRETACRRSACGVATARRCAGPSGVGEGRMHREEAPRHRPALCCIAPPSRHTISLYANISSIRWDYTSPSVKGWVTSASGAGMKAFEMVCSLLAPPYQPPPTLPPSACSPHVRATDRLSPAHLVPAIAHHRPPSPTRRSRTVTRILPSPTIFGS